MAYKKNKSATEDKALEEGGVSYYTSMSKMNQSITSFFPSKENYIQRSVAMLGAAAIKPFNQVQSSADFINGIRVGLPRKALDKLMSITGLTTDEIAGIIHTSDRTLRRYTPEQKLNAGQTERLIEIAKLYSRGEEVFGSLDVFKEWMDSTVMALGNKKPKEFLDTSLGIEMLMDELGRIEHGVFA